MADLEMRTATTGDLEVLRELYRRSSLSNEGDRANMLARPEVLHWTGDGLAAGQTRVATDGRDRILGFATVVRIEGGLDSRICSSTLRRCAKAWPPVSCSTQ